MPGILSTLKLRGGGVTISTEKKAHKRRKLSQEILGLLIISFLLAFILLQVLSVSAIGVAESFLFARDVVLTDVQFAELDDWIFHLSLLISVSFFVILFLFLLGERLSYIHEVLKGIDALQAGQEDYVVPVEGRNELTQLAEAVNYLSQTQCEIKRKERMLQEEKEQFIRSLSHDIRTPLTSIIAYSELLTGQGRFSLEEQNSYLKLIQSKAGQIKEMTDLLLDGNKRNLEYFENAHLLMKQLISDFEGVLEESFCVETCLECPAFSGKFDVQELRRIFDNLISNIQKYADPEAPVRLSVGLNEKQLVICQKNTIRQLTEPASGYRIGIRSIQRIVQNYAGQTDIQQEDGEFIITITLSEI